MCIRRAARVYKNKKTKKNNAIVDLKKDWIMEFKISVYLT